MRNKPVTRKFERLEERRVFAGVWQNPQLVLDVDSSGFVSALDALHVVNDINRDGVRELPAVKPAGYSGVLCDTSGDGIISALDVLRIVNAINRFPDPPTLNVKLSAASDLNADQVVLVSDVVYIGTATPNVSVKVERLEGEQSAVPLLATTVPGSGEFQIPLTLADPISRLRFTVADPRGRSLTTERIVRKGDVVTAWNAALLEIIRETTSPSTTVPGLMIKPPPPMVARSLAMVYGAMVDAVSAVDPQYEPYLLNVATQASASAIAAAAVAARDVAANIYHDPKQLAEWDKTLAEIMALVPEGSAKTLGTALGQQAAAAMIANRANDGSGATVTYTPGNNPGQWRPTTPDFSAATLPHWPAVAPFAAMSGDQFRPDQIPALGSAEYAAAVDEVRRLGAQTGSQRTDEQTLIATFWADGGGTSTPPGHWNQIAVDVGLENNLSLLENARMMALLNFAMTDAGIAAWDAKYAFNLWRPIDAVRNADADSNAATTADPDWLPLLDTPSFPSFVSGHSAFSGAAAEVLTSLFGEDFAFTTLADRGSGGQWPPLDDVALLKSRSFSSFREAAEEAGASRIYGGIHFNFDNALGLAMGRSIGELVMTTLLQPSAAAV